MVYQVKKHFLLLFLIKIIIKQSQVGFILSSVTKHGKKAKDNKVDNGGLGASKDSHELIVHQ